MGKIIVPAVLACIVGVIGVWAFAQTRPTATPKTPASAAPAGVATRPPATEPTSRPTTQATTRAATQPAGPPRVEMRIRQGDQDWGWIVIELNPEKAPISTRNFLRYVDEGYYNGTIFHRVIPTFMVQGGGFKTLGTEKAAGLHEPIQNEAKNGLRNERYTLAMARTGEPHSATSQFFINVADNKQLDYPSFDGWGYAVFGKVVEGMEVVEKIKNIETVAMGREKSTPVDPPVIVVAQRVK
jgi:cyclophilin family peptidyl-prolyl cis-trans isomerase